MCRFTNRRGCAALAACCLCLIVGTTAKAAPTAYYVTVHHTSLAVQDASIHFQFTASGSAARSAGTKVAGFTLSGGALSAGPASPFDTARGNSTLVGVPPPGASGRQLFTNSDIRCSLSVPDGPTRSEGGPLALLLFDANGNAPLHREAFAGGPLREMCVVAGERAGGVSPASEGEPGRAWPSPGSLIALGLSSGALVFTAYGWSRRGIRKLAW